MNEITEDLIKTLSMYNPKRKELVVKFLSLNKENIDPILEHEFRESIQEYSLLELEQSVRLLDSKINAEIDFKKILKILQDIETCYSELLAIPNRTTKDLIQTFIQQMNNDDDVYRIIHYLQFFIRSVEITNLQKDEIVNLFGCIKSLDARELNYLKNDNLRQIQAFKEDASKFITIKERYLMYFLSGQDAPEAELKKITEGVSFKNISIFLKDLTKYKVRIALNDFYGEWKFSKEVLHYVNSDMKKFLLTEMSKLLSSVNEHSLVLEYIDSVSKNALREFILTKDAQAVDTKFIECKENLEDAGIDTLLYEEVMYILMNKCKEVY